VREGLYKITFFTVAERTGLNPEVAGTGVVDLRGGQIRGGDSSFYYVGEYGLDGVKLDAKAIVVRHSRAPNTQAVFGTDKSEIIVTGSFAPDGSQAGGKVVRSFDSDLVFRLDFLVP
jgi:hypothetical protein